MPERANLLIDRVEALLEAERRFESSFRAAPEPAWLKLITTDDRLVMGMVNAAYTLATGISVVAYTGKPDHAIWAAGEAESFSEADHRVWQTGTARRIAEHADNPRSGDPEVWVGWKWPYVWRGKVVGIWGRAEPMRPDIWEQVKALLAEDH